MALTSVSRWRDYSSACEFSTGSWQAADPGGAYPMSDDQFAQLDAALEKVIAAARAHLAAVKAAEGRIDDDGVWRADGELNKTPPEDDELLLDAVGGGTPRGGGAGDPGEAGRPVGGGGSDGDEEG